MARCVYKKQDITRFSKVKNHSTPTDSYVIDYISLKMTQKKPRCGAVGVARHARASNLAKMLESSVSVCPSAYDNSR